MGEIFLVPNSGLFRWDRILNLDQGVGACFLGFFSIIILIKYVLTVWLVSCYNSLPWVQI